jgi:hypothetical protein
MPALAQTAAPDTAQAPKSDASTPIPDVGVKKVTPTTPTKRIHHTHKQAKSAPAPAKARK